MLKPRVIPALLLGERGLVKTREFAGPVYVGDFTNTVRIFNAKGADEIIVLDILASVEGRGPNIGALRMMAEECFMPLTYGGGVRSVDDIGRVLDEGVEKVSLQSAALADPGLVEQAAARFGAQSIVAALDFTGDAGTGFRVWHAARRRPDPRPWQEVVEALVAAGAGELLITSVPREGSMAGVDGDLIEAVAAICPTPVIAHGGVGSLADICEAFRRGASAVAAGSFFVFHGRRRGVLITYPDSHDFEALAECIERDT